MQRKKWIYKNASLSRDDLEKLSEKLSPMMASLLLTRGIKTEEEAKLYFQKPLGGIISPAFMPDMDKAADRIIEAVENKEKITIYGDYDVDGITSTVLMYTFLSSIGANVTYHIPSRHTEGYGINIVTLNKLIKSGTKLLISVDCGITAVGEVEFARLQGTDVIITDHHTCPEKLPKAFAVINPKIPDCAYPFEALAGVGVALKLALGVAVKLNLNTGKVFTQLCELAAIGTVADVVSLTGENRIIVDKGIKKINSGSSFPGIGALLKVAGADKGEVTSTTVAFALAPRLNASGRLGSAELSAELLLCKDEEKALSLAAELDRENQKRRQTEQEIYSDALEMIENDPGFSDKKVIVLAKKGWHQGVIGIVASKICEKFYRPAILISLLEDGTGKGSGRSIPGFNLFDALNSSAEHLSAFGGHTAAAGLSIAEENLEAFSQSINKYAASVLTDEDLVPVMEIDCEIQPSAITLGNIKFLSKLEPFGQENEMPVFSLSSASVTYFSAIGTEKQHLKLTVSKDGMSFSCIGFGFGEYAKYLKENMKIDIAFCMDINNYQNRESVQLRLKDIKSSQKERK